MLSALDNYFHDDRDVTFLADFLNAQNSVDHPEQAPCFVSALNINVEQDGCRLRVLANGTAITDWIDICETIPGFTTDCPVTCGSGADSEESDDVAVQKVWIDCETGELVVDYGGCNGECRYDLSCVTGQPGDLPDDYQPPPGGENHNEYSACGKAYHAVNAVMDVAQSIFTHCDDVYPFPVNAVKSDNPDIEFNEVGLRLALQYAWEMRFGSEVLPGYTAEWADQESQRDRYICEAASIMTDTGDDDLADDDTWQSFVSIFRGPILGNFIWGWFFDYILKEQKVLLLWTYGAMKRSQIREIALDGARDTEQTCDCPETLDPEIPTGYDWVIDYDFTKIPEDWTISEGDFIDANGIWATPTTPYGNYNFQAQALPYSADETTKIKYAKIYITSGTTEIDNNEVPLSLLFQSPIVLIPRSAFGASMPGGDTTRLWASADGQAMTNAAALQIGQAGYTNNVAANLYVKRLVIAGDGTSPYTIL